MKRWVMMSLLVAVAMTSFVGCRGRGRCNDDGCAVAGPPSATVAYPYYTVRAPRDFLAKDPPSIGP